MHLPRYLKAVVLRLDKLRADPAARCRSAWLNCARWSSAGCAARRTCKGASHARLDEYRWLLEELRVSLFAQELRTPQPVSSKRLDKAWAQLSG
jgi:ATP-dependent helicase HrpA